MFQSPASSCTMSGVKSRLSSLLGHISPGSAQAPFEHRFNNHTLSPTFFLPRAAAIEPDVGPRYLSKLSWAK